MIRAFLLALLLAAQSAAAQSFGDQADPIVRLDVLSGDVTAAGHQNAALRLTMAEGWHTYWRAPGDAGIPPAFTWRGSRNLGNVRVIWPVPQVFWQNGMRSIGYEGQLVLPIEITPEKAGRPVHLKGRMEIGVCRDICMPAELRFDTTLDNAAGKHPSIAAALAARPYSRDEAGVQAVTCALSPVRGGIRLTARITMPSAGTREDVVIESGNPKVWASEPAAKRQGNVLIASSDLVHVEKGSYALDRSAVRITVLGSRHAVDILGCTAAS